MCPTYKLSTILICNITSSNGCERRSIVDKQTAGTAGRFYFKTKYEVNRTRVFRSREEGSEKFESENLDDIEAFNRAVIERWEYKNSKHDQVKVSENEEWRKQDFHL